MTNATCEVRSIPDIAGIVDLQRHGRVHATHLADRAVRQQFGEPRPLRMVAEDERLLDVPTRPVPNLLQHSDFLDREAQRLLPRHVFAGLHRLQAHWQCRWLGSGRYTASESASNSSYDPYAVVIANSAQTTSALSRLRDARAASVTLGASAIAGTVRVRAIAAAPSTPHRTFSIAGGSFARCL